MLKEALVKYAFEMRFRVLILILMEYAQRVTPDNAFGRTPYNVLILILMEYAQRA